MKTCETCKWWWGGGSGLAHRECRRYPPQGNGSSRTGYWPLTYNSEFCGEHSGKAGRPRKNEND